MEFRFDYPKCKSCKKGSLCTNCEEELTEKLLLEPVIRHIILEISKKRLAVTSEADLPELEALLRKHGVFVH